MAIIFDTPISTQNFLNAFNNNVAIFHSDSGKTATSCEITIDGVSLPFKISPINEAFSFNFREVSRVLSNPNKFKDDVLPSADSVPDPSLISSFGVEYKIKFTDLSEETFSETYNFKRSVQQIGDKQIRTVNDPHVFNNRSMTVSEGFPFSFGYYSLFSNIDLYNKTNNKTKTVATVENGTSRIFFEDGQFPLVVGNGNGESFYLRMLNLTSGSYEPSGCVDWEEESFLEEGWNEVVIGEGSGSITVSVKYEKDKQNENGRMLKWINEDGDWNYHLFSEMHQEKISANSLGYIETNNQNLEDTQNAFLSIGKSGNKMIDLHSVRLTPEEMIYLQSIITSPRVEIYNGEYKSNANNESWQTVKVRTGSINTLNTKRYLNNISLSIELNLFTQQ